MYEGAFEILMKGVITMDDKAMIDQLWQRKDSVLSVIGLKYGKLCHSLAIGILRSEEDAEECVNDAYMKVWETIPPNRPDSLRAYIAKLTRNISIDKLRAGSRKKRSYGEREVALDEIAEIIPGGVSPEEALNEKELARIIDSFVREQANDAKMIFIARYWSYKSVSEISRELGFSQSKVKTSLHRVRTELKEKLEKEGYGI